MLNAVYSRDGTKRQRQHPSNVHNIQTMLDKRWNNVVCQQDDDVILPLKESNYKRASNATNHDTNRIYQAISTAIFLINLFV